MLKFLQCDMLFGCLHVSIFYDALKTTRTIVTMCTVVIITTIRNRSFFQPGIQHRLTHMQAAEYNVVVRKSSVICQHEYRSILNTGISRLSTVLSQAVLHSTES